VNKIALFCLSFICEDNALSELHVLCYAYYCWMLFPFWT